MALHTHTHIRSRQARLDGYFREARAHQMFWVRAGAGKGQVAKGQFPVELQHCQI